LQICPQPQAGVQTLPGQKHIIVFGLNDDGIEGALAAACAAREISVAVQNCYSPLATAIAAAWDALDD